MAAEYPACWKTLHCPNNKRDEGELYGDEGADFANTTHSCINALYRVKEFGKPELLSDNVCPIDVLVGIKSASAGISLAKIDMEIRNA